MNKDISVEVQKSYKKVIKDYKTKVKSKNLDHSYIEHFLALFKPGQKILDIGCGTGAISNEIATNHHLEVVATDISQDMVELAKKLHPHLRVLRMDLRKLKFPPASFHGVFANYSLIHIPNAEVASALKQVKRIIKPGGFLYLSLQEPIKKMDHDGFFPLVYKPEVKMFLNLTTEKGIRKSLREAGFKIKWLDRRPPNKKFEFEFNKLFVIAQK